MKKIIFKNWLLLLGLSLLMLTSCEKTEDEPPITANNLKGMFVVCEGVYGQANGDISFLNIETGVTKKSLYYSVNGVALGDVVQSFEIVDTLGFIVVNNSQKVTVVNMKDFKVVKTIDGFSYPRSVVRAGKNSVYVSNGKGVSRNYIYKISLPILDITDSLQVSTGPEKLLSVKSKVYAAISGGWNSDGKTVIEIDPSSFSVVNTFNVLSVPVDITVDKNNDIWVYCKGIPDYSDYPNVTYSEAGICKITTSTKTVNSFPITNMSSSGINNITASKDGNTIYYLNDALYSMSITASSLPSSKLVDQQFYGVDADPQTGNIVCLDVVNSKAVVYTATFKNQTEFETAKFPNSVAFSY